MIPFEKLDFGEAVVHDQFYSSDAAIVDLSIADQQSALFYHIGIRESFGMKHNILLYNGSPESARELRTTCSKMLSNHSLVTYKVNDAKQCVLTEPGSRVAGDEGLANSSNSFCSRLRRLLQEVEVQTK